MKERITMTRETRYDPETNLPYEILEEDGVVKCGHELVIGAHAHCSCSLWKLLSNYEISIKEIIHRHDKHVEDHRKVGIEKQENNRKHILNIESLGYAKASCSCGKWELCKQTCLREDEISKEHDKHVVEDDNIEYLPVKCPYCGVESKFYCDGSTGNFCVGIEINCKHLSHWGISPKIATFEEEKEV